MPWIAFKGLKRDFYILFSSQIQQKKKGNMYRHAVINTYWIKDCQIIPNSGSYIFCLKGQCHEIFECRFFGFLVLFFAKNWRRYSNMKSFPQCKIHRGVDWKEHTLKFLTSKSLCYMKNIWSSGRFFEELFHSIGITQVLTPLTF